MAYNKRTNINTNDPTDKTEKSRLWLFIATGAALLITILGVYKITVPEEVKFCILPVEEGAPRCE